MPIFQPEAITCWLRSERLFRAQTAWSCLG